MTIENPRIKREKKTIEEMIKIYCKANHNNTKTICKNCQTLLDYASMKLTDCPYQKDKPTCKNCKIHCYKEPEKTKIRKIMRYSGPMMLFKHPILAIQHIIDEKKKNLK